MLAFGQEPELALHLVEVLQAPGVERTAFERGADRAAGFLFVFAVAEPALAGELLDVRERAFDVALAAPELELASAAPVGQCAQARRVHQEAAAGQRYQFALRGDVSALADSPADRAGLLAFLAEQAVDDG